jgi:hypothetical protein
MVEKAMGGPELAIGDRLEELEERFRGWRESRHSAGRAITSWAWRSRA